MLPTIEVSDAEIDWSETILLRPGKHFAPEARCFIKCLDKIDLQAVPGSGKTTALLAKLLIIGKKLPFESNAGILVLSHTNAAVDEIKKELYPHCPQLFAYPNFIGTIQGFVDQFLAIPCAQNLFGTRILRIDQEVYEDKLWRTYRKDAAHFEINKLFFGRHITRAQKEAKTSTRTQTEILKDLIEQEFKSLYFDHFDRAIKLYPSAEVLLKDPTKERFQNLKKILAKVFASGVIPFHYAYHLGAYYLQTIPQIKSLLRLRFPLVFVDEMQDMDEEQCKMLESLFQGVNCGVKFQRIGDKNQSIYHAVKSGVYWQDQNKVYPLNGSQRLTNATAQIVSPFAVSKGEQYNLIGLRAGGVQPHLLVYDDGTIQDVVPYFAEKVSTYVGNNQLEDFGFYPVKVIAWNTEWNKKEDSENAEKIRLVDYFPSFRKQDAAPKLEHATLKEYLIHADTTSGSMNPVRKNILNALIKIFRMENCMDERKKNFTKRTLINHLREQNRLLETDCEERLKKNVYHWALRLVQGELETVWKEMQTFIPSFLKALHWPYSESKSFLTKEPDIVPTAIEKDHPQRRNHYVRGPVSIDFGTVHSSKGQTHCATLYLESYYNKHYEVEILSKAFTSQSVTDIIDLLQKEIAVLEKKLVELNGKRGTKTKQKKVNSLKKEIEQMIETAKMIYVGFSRPTNLLCYAVHRKRFEEYLTDLNPNIWKIETVTKIADNALPPRSSCKETISNGSASFSSSQS